ncbi:NAD-dependent succinate-semialdehyde dehydrogenase [Egicoccus halophilus]|uniref:NAD-dependent succinate-semialdehyde dehydrogenase n=2 Tax=Egicoccus halophilus TaxID=1670830 RepID=A0A8J3AAF1_9ACTN|nr:NAD-dependent succinate-semialdehyde dehydrogenase [Egicoccus halophilus]GGI08695.1 NAD-dependent succinate-semialdehyde dehydrogenase [Egicoccus halophilus]
MVDTPTIPPVPTGLYVAGAWHDADDGRTFPVTDPATDQVVATVADAGPDEARRALDAAVAAQPSWAATSPRERSELLRAVFDTLVAQREELAQLIATEMGKSRNESRAEVTYASEFFRWYSEEAVRIGGRTAQAPHANGRIETYARPVGPSLFITPWNFPLAMLARKVAPALAAGCTTITKPAPETPLSANRLAQIFDELDTPHGVVNVLATSRARALVEPLLADPRLRKLSFTGSTEVGRELLRSAAGNVLRTSMELGGNAPFLVLEDADVEAAADAAAIAKMRNIGQSCVAANRFLVHESVAEPFAHALAVRLQRPPLAPGWDGDDVVGALIDRAACERIEALVRDACDRGAKALIGGDAVDGPGSFYAPTVLYPCPVDAEILRQEIFGPVAPITAVASEDEAIERANDTPFGLIAYVHGRDVDRCRRLAERLETGMVAVNRGVISEPAAPFGGAKQSGLGREGGAEGLEAYVETQYVGLP